MRLTDSRALVLRRELDSALFQVQIDFCFGSRASVTAALGECARLSAECRETEKVWVDIENLALRLRRARETTTARPSGV